MTEHSAETRKFVRFHRENPQIMWVLRELALRQVRSGVVTVSMRSLFEVLRTQAERGQGGARLDNRLAPLYARALRQLDPSLRSAFTLRGTRGGVPLSELGLFPLRRDGQSVMFEAIVCD